MLHFKTWFPKSNSGSFLFSLIWNYLILVTAFHKQKLLVRPIFTRHLMISKGTAYLFTVEIFIWLTLSIFFLFNWCNAGLSSPSEAILLNFWVRSLTLILASGSFSTARVELSYATKIKTYKNTAGDGCMCAQNLLFKKWHYIKRHKLLCYMMSEGNKKLYLK